MKLFFIGFVKMFLWMFLAFLVVIPFILLYFIYEKHPLIVGLILLIAVCCAGGYLEIINH